MFQVGHEQKGAASPPNRQHCGAPSAHLPLPQVQGQSAVLCRGSTSNSWTTLATSTAQPPSIQIEALWGLLYLSCHGGYGNHRGYSFKGGSSPSISQDPGMFLRQREGRLRVAEDGSELWTFLLLPPRCKDYRHAPPHTPFMQCLRLGPRAASVLYKKHSPT